MYHSSSGMIHVQPKSEYHPPPPLPLSCFGHLPTFERFPKLPPELRNMVWKSSLPNPEILHVQGNIVYDPQKGHHILTFAIRSFNSAYTDLTSALHQSRALSCTRVCKESRDVYLKTFPLTMEACGDLQYDSPFTNANPVKKGLVHFSKDDRLFINNLESMCHDPHLNEVLQRELWTGCINTIYLRCELFGNLTNEEESYSAAMWVILQAFPNVTEMRGVAGDEVWFLDGINMEKAFIFRLKCFRRALIAVQDIRCWKKELPIFSMMHISNMEAMNEIVLLGENAMTDKKRKG